MKKLFITLLSIVVAIVVGATVYDNTTESTTTFTFDKSVKYVYEGTNDVAYYVILGTNGETFYVDKEDVDRWKDKRLYRGRNYEVTTYGAFAPRIKTLRRLKNVANN